MQQHAIKAEDTSAVVLCHECPRAILNHLDVGKMCITDKTLNNTPNSFIDPVTCTLLHLYVPRTSTRRKLYNLQHVDMSGEQHQVIALERGLSV